ncbi:unnamed protein product [Schistosoma turkestanicum]|nr:unnamed protein product [Schistosoma turkestanicum]
MADDLDVSNETAKFAKKGRRAKLMSKDKDGLSSSEINLRKASGEKTTDLPECKIGGWNEGEISHIASFGRRAQEDINNVCKTLLNEDSDEELEIPIVPDLSSAEDQSITFEGAVAPSVVINKIPSYSELTQDLLHHGMLQLLDDHINIRVLTRHLFSESELQESDETWGWDFLFTELKTLR